MQHLLLLSLTATVVGSLAAQSNKVPGLDGRLTIVDQFTYLGRRGAAHPNGEIGAAMMNEMCNPGSVTIPWFAAMQPNHPKFGFLMVRVANDRLEQISDRSLCKHAFFSTNSASTCGGTCVYPGSGSEMGLHCSDVYGVGNNGDQTTLGPADELNPWTGVWVPTGSYFDIGDPSQASFPAQVNGAYSLDTSGFDSVKSRVTMKEQDLLTPGAQYFYGIHLMHEGESLTNRWDNLASRGCTPAWNGSAWTFNNNAVAQAHGSILQRWSGASVDLGGNGSDDGRFAVAAKTTALGGGSYHYEYAIHNIDNSRGGATFRLPVDPAGVVSNYTFGDIDTNPLNDWTGARVGNEVVFTAPGGNSLKWNTIYNFGFDCNIQPSTGTSKVDQALAGPGALTVDVTTKVPSGVPGAEATSVGTGCVTCASSFYETPGFDLANTKVKLTYSGGAYTVGVSTNTFVTPVGGDQNLTDDSDVSAALGFTLNYPGGSTSTIRICSNGFLSPGTGNGTSYLPSTSEFLTSALPRWAPAWHDFAPAGAGDVYVDPAPGVLRVTWLNVPNYTGGLTNTFQVQFESSGNVHFLYQTMNVNADAYLTGWTRGGNAADPGNRDISATLAAGWTMCATDTTPIVLNASARPVLNTTINLVTSNMPAGTFAALQLLGFTSLIPGVDLTFLDMPGCFLYATPDITISFATPTSSYAWPFFIPLDLTLVGVSVMAQTVTFSPGFTPSGLLSSNGVQLLFGQQ